MYCSRTLSASDTLTSFSNDKENDYLKQLMGITESEKDDKEDWYGDELFKIQDTLDNEDGNMNVITQEPCDSNLSQTLNELNFEMNNLRISNENIGNHILNKNSSLVSQLMNISQEENSITEANNFSKDINHNDKVNNGDVLEDDLHLFNSNIYWYISPELPLDSSIIAGKEPSSDETSNLNTVSTTLIHMLLF